MRSIQRYLLFFLIYSGVLYAHQTGLSYLSLEKAGEGLFDVTYKKPLEDLRAGSLTINYPPLCLLSSDDTVKIENGFIITHGRLQCRNGLMGKQIWIGGLVRSDKGVLFRYADGKRAQQDLVRAIHPFVEIGEKVSRGEIFVKYLSLGVFHILTGYDHLLFVLALLFLAASFRELLASVTAFTLAHSVTLGLGIFGLVNVPVPFVEAMIAASIVILYREVLTDTAQKGRHLPVVVFFFGLLHGLGFASALSGIGLPREEIPASLLAFNIGIELGQLCFIVSAFLLLKILYRLIPLRREMVRHAIAWSAGSFASFWMIERVMAF